MTQSQAPAAPAVAIDADDIGGVVASANGPEAGVWVVAETDGLPTKFTRIVVTDQQGRYVVPDLPKAAFRVWVRGYGLVDSQPVAAGPGQRLNLTAAIASSRREAAAIFPAAYWLSMVRVPTTGPIGQAQLTQALKSCMACHQLGDKATREIPAAPGPMKSHLEMWDRRVGIGPSGPAMAAQFKRLGVQRSLLAEWTERIAAGELPEEMPPRPEGIERNIVVTMWDWGGPTTIAHDEAASDRRDYRINANGRVWAPSPSHDALLWLDPVRHAAGQQSIPAAEPRSALLDRRGRVWIAARHQPGQSQPAFCQPGSSNRFAAYYALAAGTRQVTVYDPAASRFIQIDTCFTADHNDFSRDDKVFFGMNSAVGWIDARAIENDAPLNAEAVQGWCPGVVDTNADGTITQGWTEPDQPIDAKKDHRIEFGCEHAAVAPDGSVWCGPGGESDNRIVRLEIGANPPQTCKAEVFEVPASRDARGSRGLDVDSRGVAWINMASTDQFASFDRRKCRALNGPAATGPHCPEGWRFYQIPGPPFSGPYSPGGAPPAPLQGRGTARTSDMMYLTTVDRFDVLQLNAGRDVPFTELANSDALLAFLPEANEMITLRVPYPLGFFARSIHGRIDDPTSGWKGRGLWSSYASEAPWHIEGGRGTRPKAVKFQVRPDPLAK